MNRVVMGRVAVGLGLLVWGVCLIGADPAVESEVVKQAASKQVEAKGPPAGMWLPVYDATGGLVRPTGYERWVVVGTSIGLSYAEGEQQDPKKPGMFHNVFMQPEAFDQYVKTGEFAEQTVFIVTNNPSHATEGKDDLNRQGFFAAPATGLEVAIKDSKRFEDGWAYYMFHDRAGRVEGKGQETEMPFPRKECFDCHVEHGKRDNVFTQFYSVLTQARERELEGK